MVRIKITTRPFPENPGRFRGERNKGGNGVGVFEKAPEFIEQDNRRFRPNFRINTEIQERRHAAMLPAASIAGKRVLDLGCCIGATGYWCLENGATSYLGVEAQQEYVDIARTNLAARFAERAEVLHAGIEDFLEANQREFDVVVMAGVIYSFVDFMPVLRKVAAITKESIVVESLFPRLQAEGARFPNESIIEVRTDQPMNLATQNASAVVYGSVPAPNALRILLATLGFKPQILHVGPWKGRYIAVFQRGQKQGVEFAEVAQGASAPVSNWLGDSVYQGAAESGAWEFDENVARSFRAIAYQNIPNYQVVLQKCVDVARKTCLPTDRIIDVGCASGEILYMLHASGFRNLFGVDNSAAMVQESMRAPAKIMLSDKFPEVQGPYKLVTANWTLHFIERRYEYISSIHRALQPDGILLLTDKMQSGGLMRELYHDFKRERGMTDRQIADKEESIKGILNPHPLGLYLEYLKSLFRQVDILDASYGFVTLMAIK
jgi:tRNA (cmo5U34)-methyltransferase